jgi:hypothetical protein
MVERVSTKSYGCNFQGGDSGPAARRLRPVVLALACHRVGQFRRPPKIGPETLCLWPETPGRRAEAGDSGLSGLAQACTKGWTAQTPTRNWAGDFCLRPKTLVLESLRAETPALLARDSCPSRPATVTFRGGLYKAFFYLYKRLRLPLSLLHCC